MLGGRAMEVVHQGQRTRRITSKTRWSSRRTPPFSWTGFLDLAIEVDVDAVCDGDACGARRRDAAHIEQAGDAFW